MSSDQGRRISQATHSSSEQVDPPQKSQISSLAQIQEADGSQSKLGEDHLSSQESVSSVGDKVDELVSSVVQQTETAATQANKFPMQKLQIRATSQQQKPKMSIFNASKTTVSDQAGVKPKRHTTVDAVQSMVTKSRNMNSRYGEFVKISEVRDIVEDMILPMISAMKKREEEALSMSNSVAILKDEMKKQRGDTRQCLLLKNTIYDNNKTVKKLEANQSLVDETISNISQVVDVRINKLQAKLDENYEEQQKFFDISAQRNKNYLDLSAAFHRAQCETTDEMKKHKEDINNILIKQNEKLKKMAVYKDQLVVQIDNHKEEMIAKWAQCQEEIMDKLKVQELRMQEIEIAHLKVIEFQKQFVEFKITVATCMRSIEQLKGIPQMLERHIPLMIHFQLCEGLRKTVDDLAPSKLSDFEMTKLKELVEFQNSYSNSEPNLKAFSAKLVCKSRELYKLNKGMVSFQYGKDYRPDMMMDEANQLNQIERIAITFLTKMYSKDSILESLLVALKEIQKEKTLSNEDCGKEFAALLTRPPPEHHDYDDYDDEYGDEDDYGHEEYHHHVNQQHNRRNPFTNERLKQSNNAQRGVTNAGGRGGFVKGGRGAGRGSPGANMRQSIRGSQHSEGRQTGGFEGNVRSSTGLRASRGKGKGGMHGAASQHDPSNFYRTQHSPGGVPLSGGRGPDSAGSSSVGRGRGRKSFRSGGGGRQGGGGFRQVMNTFQLVQKPTRAHQKKLEMTLRTLKRRGFDLYTRCKKESKDIFTEIKEMTEKMQAEQMEALRVQDIAMKNRVETRLTQIQEDFLRRTEAAAEQIFEENHKKVFDLLDKNNARVKSIEDYHVESKKLYDVLFKQNSEAIILHKNVEKIFKEESESFFQERNRWRTDAQHLIDQQDREIENVRLSQKEIREMCRVNTESLAILVDCSIMSHMVQANITNDMKKVNLMGAVPGHDMIYKNEKKSPIKLRQQSSIVVEEEQDQLNETDQSVLDIGMALNRASMDPGTQGRFIKFVKQACLDFKSSPIQYRQNLFKQTQIISLNKELLLHIQQILASSGIYQRDPFFAKHVGHSFYVRPLNDLASLGGPQGAAFISNNTVNQQSPTSSVIKAMALQHQQTMPPPNCSIMDIDSPSQQSKIGQRGGRKIIRVPSPKLTQNGFDNDKMRHRNSTPEDFMRSETSGLEHTNTTFSEIMQQRFTTTTSQLDNEKNYSRNAMSNQAKTSPNKGPHSQGKYKRNQTIQEVDIVQNYLEESMKLPKQLEKRLSMQNQKPGTAVAGSQRTKRNIAQNNQTANSMMGHRLNSAAGVQQNQQQTQMSHYDSIGRAGNHTANKLQSYNNKYQTQSALHGQSITNATTANIHPKHNATGSDLATPMDHQSMTFPVSSILSHQGPLSVTPTKNTPTTPNMNKSSTQNTGQNHLKVQRMNQELAKQQFLQNRQIELSMMHNAIHSKEELASAVSHKRNSSNVTAQGNHNSSMPVMAQDQRGGASANGNLGPNGKIKSHSVLSQRNPAVGTNRQKNMAVQLRLEVAANAAAQKKRLELKTANNEPNGKNTQCAIQEAVVDNDFDNCIKIEADQPVSGSKFGFHRTQTKLMDAVDERLDTSSSANIDKTPVLRNKLQSNQVADKAMTAAVGKDEPDIQTPASIDSPDHLVTKYGPKNNDTGSGKSQFINYKSRQQ